MKAIDLNDYFYFVHVIEKGGFSSAAEALGIPKSRLSRHVQQLEERLDTRLIQRTTRQFNLTEMGEVLYHHARNVIDEMEMAESAITRKKNTLSGNVTMSCSVGMAQFTLKELLARFLRDNPQVTVSQQVSNQFVDLVADGIDLSIRGHAEPLPDSSMIQRQLTVVEWNLFAASTYLKEFAAITCPQDLINHDTLALGWQSPQSQWKLEHQSGEVVEIGFTPRLKSEDMTTLKQAAVSGLGIVALPAYTCHDELESGLLVRVLPEWHVGLTQISLIMPTRRGQAPSVIALRDFLLAEFAEFVKVD